MQQSFPTTQVSLILRLRNASDADAWEQFISIYHPLIWSTAKRLQMSDADAHDACQNTLFRLSQVVHQWSPDKENSNFRGWLFRVSRNCMLREFEKNKKQIGVAITFGGEQFLNQLAEDPDESESKFQLELRRQLFAVAIEAVEPLIKPLYWDAFRLSYIENKGIKETAELLKTDVQTVYVARHRVLNQIRDEVKKWTQWQEYLGPQ